MAVKAAEFIIGHTSLDIKDWFIWHLIHGYLLMAILYYNQEMPGIFLAPWDLPWKVPRIWGAMTHRNLGVYHEPNSWPINGKFLTDRINSRVRGKELCLRILFLMIF
jgi:hypothetical protein